MSGKKQNQHPNDPMSVDVLLFGAHPDDADWGAGGSMLMPRVLHSVLWISREVKWDPEVRARKATKRGKKPHPQWVPLGVLASF
jgi:hypothetical protein